MSSASTRVACAQLAPRIADLPGNRELTTDAIDRAVHAGAQVVVLPELATCGYMFDDQAEARAVAVPATSTIFDQWAGAAGTATVIGGFCELGEDGRLFNSAAVVDGRGLRAVYRKTHLWDREAEVFAAGDGPPPVVDTAAGRLGVLICYDLEFPELTRSLALRGADLVAVPANWPLVPRPDGERPPEVVIAMAAARVNRMAIACCDRTGDERGQAWTGGTSIVDRNGWVVATPGTGDLATADLDLVASRDKRLSDRNDALGDRRPELYTRSPARDHVPDPPAQGPLVHRIETLVFLPGMLGAAQTWGPVAERLEDVSDPRIGRIDLDDSITEMAASVLAEAPRRFALAGHSLGGIVALEVVRQAPHRVTRLALCNTSARDASPAQQEGWSTLAERVRSEPFDRLAHELAVANLPEDRREDDALVQAGSRMAWRIGPDGLLRQLAAQSTRPDSRPLLPTINVPTLVLTGERDRVCPAALQEEIAAGIPGAVHAVVGGVGHMAPMEDPDAVAGHLRAWLSASGSGA